MEYFFQLANICLKGEKKNHRLICFMFQNTKELLLYPKCLILLIVPENSFSCIICPISLHPSEK